MEAFRKYLPLNLQLMGEPVNWLILFLMVAIVGLAVSLISTSPATAE